MTRVSDALARAARNPAPDAPVVEAGPDFPTEAQVDVRPERAGDAAFRPEDDAGERPAPASTPVPALSGSLTQEKLITGITAERGPVEQYRRLAARLHLAQAEHGTRVVMVTSAVASEGKTLTATNLALTLSESYNRRVLLIDADLRRPRIHQVFGMANTFGLSDLLSSTEPIEQIPLKASSLRTGVPGLYVLPSGSRTYNISSLLHSPRLGELLERALRVFDTVLIDTPPVKQIADARVLGRLSDGIVLVLRAGQTTRGTAKAAADRFAEDGIRVLGTVLNSWDPETNGSGYYDGYSYDESYYTEDRAEAAQASG
jgi:capsular exopolysaccharide synthesis family protein